MWCYRCTGKSSVFIAAKQLLSGVLLLETFGNCCCAKENCACVIVCMCSEQIDDLGVYILYVYIYILYFIIYIWTW